MATSKKHEIRLPKALPAKGTFVGPDSKGFYLADCGCRWNSLHMIQCPLHTAAPDLLDACRSALKAIEGRVAFPPYGEPPVSILRAAISKASANNI